MFPTFHRVAIIAAFLSFSLCGTAGASDFVEPPVFASKDGVLDILLVAKPKPVSAIAFRTSRNKLINPTGWVYEVCYRSRSFHNRCLAGGSTTSEYGGVRLALQPGDILKVRLVNKLPRQDKAKVWHYWNPDTPNGQVARPLPDMNGMNLPLTPTNLHTHGLVVQARGATVENPTWGDDIYVSIYNPANGMPMQHGMDHGAVITKGFADYVIDIPANEPSGADWFHPHVHGITSDSLSSGLAGIISIGSPARYAKLGDDPFPEDQVRHLILKDMQVLAAGKIGFQQGSATTNLPVRNGEVLDDQQDPQFCTQYPANLGETRLGSCPGTNNTAQQGNNYTGGSWYFPVSGVVYPTIAVNKPKGELWSISNTSASASYKVELNSNLDGGYPILMQVVSVDGISVNLPHGTTQADMQKLMGERRADLVPCPGTWPDNFPEPMCIKSIVMLPGARTELWVTWRDRDGNIANPPPSASATLRTVGITTGETGVGDPWPAINLANVTFSGTYTDPTLVALKLEGEAKAANAPQGIFVEQVPYAQPAPLPQGCTPDPLPPGYHRRIFFGLEDVTNPNVFGLGYENVDSDGHAVEGSYHPIKAFDPSNPFICIPRASGQMPVTESWELINLATENHNFHIHQTKFRAVDPGAATGSPLNASLDPNVGAGVMEDEVSLQVAVPDGTIANEVANDQNGYCDVQQWRDGHCLAVSKHVNIPFAETGEFVYHCHILEHEDAGMMAKIEVVPARAP